MVASLGPIPSVESRPSPDDVTPAAAAGILLERGMQAFSAHQYKSCNTAFKAALETNRLNDAGRSLAYWHLFVCNERMDATDRSADALSSFIVLAEDILAFRDALPFAASEGDFADHFALEYKLRLARAHLSARWAQHTHYFGRSAEHPVPVHDQGELEHFLGMMAPICDDARHDRAQRKMTNGAGEDVRHITLTCGQVDDDSVDYYFFVR